ncbi:MAG: hypothetical protein ABL984_11955 [Pyrinomonadaceae bacterium]
MSKNILGQWNMSGGYASSVPRTIAANILGVGSENVIVTGAGYIRCVGQFVDKNPASEKGSWQFFLTDEGYAGLGNHSLYGEGSVFKVQRVLAFTGTGAVRFNGVDLGVSADSTLRYLKKSSGTWVTPAFPASQARPSSQTIYPKASPGAGHTGMNGTIATVTWRIDSTTGQVSLASLPSNTLTLSGQSVIQPFPVVATGQDYWGIGVSKVGFGDAPVFYQLKTDLGGEVAETTLAYTRTIAQASITNGDTTLTLNGATPLADRFTASDVGRRVEIAGKLDSWIVEVTDAFNAETNDDATATATDEALIVRHAIDGILRAVEIHWTTESLFGQDLAPFDAYPPPSNLAYAGILNDTLFVEDTNGIIYVGVPAYIGSFPPKQTLFPTESATLYLDGSDGVYWRFSRNTLCVLTYIGGPRPLELQQIWKNTGVLFPQNAAIGMGGRVIAWSGKPVRLGSGREPDVEFAYPVYKDFEGWSNQTQARPVIAAFDTDNQLEIWAYDKKIMAYHVPSGQWCPPINVTGMIGLADNLISSTIIGGKLYFATNSGTNLILHGFDQGNAMVAKIRTLDVRSKAKTDTISEIEVIARVDNTQSIQIKVCKNFNEAALENVDTYLPTALPIRQTILRRPNILAAKQHAIDITITSTGKDAGIELVETSGESSSVFVP